MVHAYHKVFYRVVSRARRLSMGRPVLEEHLACETNFRDVHGLGSLAMHLLFQLQYEVNLRFYTFTFNIQLNIIHR